MNEPLELAEDIARIRGLYKLLPLPPSPLRVLEIVASNQTPVIFGQLTEVCDLSKIRLIGANLIRLGYSDVEHEAIQSHPLEYLCKPLSDENGYDLIILHGSYSELYSSLAQAGLKVSHQQLFNILKSLLNNAGVIAGCVSNRLSSRGLIALVRQNKNKPRLSLIGLKNNLTASGFNEARIFSLYPGRLSPLNLAEVNMKPDTRFSKDQINYLKNWLGKPNYIMKWLLSLLGISLWFEDEYFFYARKS